MRARTALPTRVCSPGIAPTSSTSCTRFDVFAQSSEYEGTPNCVLEAMAVGAPVVATTVGGTAELIDDHVHGLLVPPQIRRRWPRQSRPRWTIRRRHRPRRGRPASASNGRFSFDARMRKVEQIYEALVDGHGRATPTTAVA